MARPEAVVSERARDALGAEALHEGAPVGLLLEAHLHHVDHDLEPEEGPGERQGRPPLTRAGLCGDALDALLLVVEGLGDRGVGLVAAGRAHALVFVIDLGRRLQGLLEPTRPIEGRGAPLAVDIAHGPGDLDLALRAHFLLDDGAREDHRQVVRPDGLLGAGMQDRVQRLGQVRVDVVPEAGQLPLVEQEFDRIAHDDGWPRQWTSRGGPRGRAGAGSVPG